jgi:hypothetical protein
MTRHPISRQCPVRSRLSYPENGVVNLAHRMRGCYAMLNEAISDSGEWVVPSLNQSSMVCSPPMTTWRWSTTRFRQIGRTFCRGEIQCIPSEASAKAEKKTSRQSVDYENVLIEESAHRRTWREAVRCDLLSQRVSGEVEDVPAGSVHNH